MILKSGKIIKDIVLIQHEIKLFDMGGAYTRYIEENIPFLNNVYFVQENEVLSKKNVLRGMGYQKEYPQGKLIHVVSGAIYDVIVDLRVKSNTFGKWEGFRLNDEERLFLWIPPGFAHGYLTLKDKTKIVYKCTEYYHSEDEDGFRWDDKKVNIHWPIDDPSNLIICDRDKKLGSFNDCFKYKEDKMNAGFR